MDAKLLAALDKLHPPLPEGKEHLVYKDFPKVTLPIWNWIKEVLGPYELHLLSEARYEHDGITLARGQIWVHPDGLPALKEAFNGEAIERLRREEAFPDEKVETA